MANPEHLHAITQKYQDWYEWKYRNPGVIPDLADSDLRGIRIPGVDLSGAILNGANLAGVCWLACNFSGAQMRRANLHGANFGGSNFSATVLSGADLTEADLSRASLTNADLSGAKLVWTTFRGGSVENANLSNALLFGTVFAELDISSVKGLEAVRHDAPSTIGVETIIRSKGQIPQSFLRGCGVPENFITYMRSLTGAAFDFFSCFISYSTNDQPFADRLHADLQARGVRCWFAPHDIQGGRKIHEQIDEAIRVYDKLLLILSDASMNSEWVGEEIARVRKRERLEKRRMLFPITIVPYESVRGWECFDADAGKDGAREVREYFVPDFSNWKDHDSYSAAFERLIRDLKATAAALVCMFLILLTK